MFDCPVPSQDCAPPRSCPPRPRVFARRLDAIVKVVRAHGTIALCGLLGAWSAGACTEVGLQPLTHESAVVYDDELRVTGEVCASAPEDTVFPVKVLFVVDTSDSMSVTDRGGVRAQAVAKVMQRYAGQPGAQFAVIAFDARIDVLTDGFTNTPDISKVSERLASADRLTDYQGALGAAYTLLSTDMAKSSPAERVRSKYVVIFFSDGAPDPQCSSRPTACGAATCPAGQHCRATTCMEDYLICSVDKDDWETAFDPPLDPELYPELDKGADYNQPYQILRAVDDLVALREFYRVGDIRLHTGFLFDEAAASDPLAVPFGLDREGGIDIMSQMAEHGFGDFMLFETASKISFLNIDYTSFKEDVALVSLLATNVHARAGADKAAVDTDGDGLPDVEEETRKTCLGRTSSCANPRDTDGDGYSDLVELRNATLGFDPLDPKKPSFSCSQTADSDGDGLADCEEAFYKTDAQLPDSDGDRLTDWMEILNGLDPLDPTDGTGDFNRDGERNLDEIVAHLDPKAALPPDGQRRRYLYDIVPFNREADGRRCYRVDVRHVQLVTTGKGTDSPRGYNRVLVYFDEAPLSSGRDYGNYRVACMTVRYVDGGFKSPPSGVVSVSDESFVSLSRFDPTKDCRDLTFTPIDAGSD